METTELEDSDYESIPDTSMAVNMVAGAVAGITEHVVTFPFDSIKTRMQVINSSHSSLASTIRKIYSTEGLFSLYRGVNTVVLGSGPAHALFFGFYEQSKILFEQQDHTAHKHLSHAFAGIVATLAHDGFNVPFDVIKQRMQLSNAGMVECFKNVVKREGARALFVSYPTTLIMSIPFQSIQFTTYEYVKKKISTGYDPTAHIIAGGISGGLASILTNPLDVCKTLLQTRGIQTEPKLRHASGLADAFRIIREQRGILGFARGINARLLTHVPSTAVAWTTYEFLKFVLLRNSQ